MEDTREESVDHKESEAVEAVPNSQNPCDAIREQDTEQRRNNNGTNQEEKEHNNGTNQEQKEHKNGTNQDQKGHNSGTNQEQKEQNNLNGEVEKKEENGEEKGRTEEQKKQQEEEKKADDAPETVDKSLLKEQFQLFSKFGDKTADGNSIKLSQSDKWFKQAGIIDGKNLSTTDTGIAFRKIAKNNPKLSFAGWSKYLEEISTCKGIHVNTLKTKLVECGKPGLSGATSVAKNAAVNRLTDSSRYGGTHKQRFDASGKGRGKDGREDAPSDGYVKGYKHKGTYDKDR